MTVVGGLALGIGLIVGISPVRTSQLNYPSCGSALFPSGGGHFNSGDLLWDSLDNGLYRTLCEQALAPMRVWALILGAVGIALLIWGIVRIANTPKAAVARSSGSTDVASQLSELARLKETGVLTDDEFKVAKGRLLVEGAGPDSTPEQEERPPSKRS